MKVTHLSLSDTDRQLLAMLAALRKSSLSEYVAGLVRSEAERAGLAEFLADAELGGADEQQSQPVGDGQ